METETIRPISTRTIGYKLEGARKTPGGIIIPDTKKERAMMGKITSVRFGALDLEVGDTILFGRAAPKEIKLESGDYFSIKEEDILAKTNEEYSFIRPLRNFVLVERKKKPTKAGSIIMPELSKKMQFEGTVIGKGPHVTLVKHGDYVLYEEYSFYLLNVPNREFLIVPEDKIMGIVHG